ncbi:MAG: TolC family protein [Bacteroidetes bacterium]|nr:TolC family protein [Bacteroidota bacterium]
MTTKRKSKFLLFVSWLVAPLLSAQPIPEYNDFINNVRTYHPLAIRANNLKAKGDWLFKSAQGGYDPLISAEFENKNFDSKTYYSTLLTKIKQPIYTSQYITTGYEYGSGYYLNPEFKTPSYGLPYIGIEASLLQGLVTDKRRTEIMKAKGYRNYYDADRNILLNDLMYSATITYFEWIYSHREISIQRYFVRLAEDRYNGIRALADLGEKAVADTIEASILYRGRSLDLRSAELEYRKRSISLRMLNWGSEGPMNAMTEGRIRDSLEYYCSKALLAWSFKNKGNAGSNPLLIKYESTDNILKADMRYKAELIKPKLDVKYNFLFNTNKSGSAVADISNYRVAVNFSMPLLLRTSRSDYQIARLERTNNQQELQNKKNEISQKLSLAEQNLDLLKEQIQNAETNAHYSKLLVDAEKLKYEHGESSLFLINTRESKLLETDLKLAEYRLKFLRSYFEYIYLLGTMEYSL